MSKYKLINHPQYYLLVGEHISEMMAWGYNDIDKIHRITSPSDAENMGDNKIIAHLPKQSQPILEGVFLLPELASTEKEDVEQLADNYIKKLHPSEHYGSEAAAYIAGYNAAKQSDKYSEEDLYKAMNWAISEREWAKAKFPLLNIGAPDFMAEFKKRLEGADIEIKTFLQSLSVPKEPVDFEVEMEDESKFDDYPVEWKKINLPKLKVVNGVLQGKWI